jgi:exosortase K
VSCAPVFALPRSCKRSRAFWDLSLAGVVLAVACLLKRHYSSASADELAYVLGPTAALVEVVTGARFVAEARAGYLSRELSTLIGPSCAGVNFLVIAWCMLACGFVRQMSTLRARAAWLAMSAAAAYAATVTVNAVRIVIAAALNAGRLSLAWAPPDQIHRVEGVLVYLSALLLLFAVAGAAVRRWAS